MRLLQISCPDKTLLIDSVQLASILQCSPREALQKIRKSGVKYWVIEKTKTVILETDIARIRKHRKTWNIAPWTKEEDDLLIKHYSELFSEEIPLLFPSREPQDVQNRSGVLKLKKKERKVLFPKIYEDDELGGYITGLIDGEACFSVATSKRKNKKTIFNPRFGLGLRWDDLNILQFMKQYFQCGYINKEVAEECNPMGTFSISNLYHILQTLIPHFDKYPLRTRKRRQYEVWKDLVKIQAKFFRLLMPYKEQKEVESMYEKLKKAKLYDFK